MPKRLENGPVPGGLPGTPREPNKIQEETKVKAFELDPEIEEFIKQAKEAERRATAQEHTDLEYRKQRMTY